MKQTVSYTRCLCYMYLLSYLNCNNLNILNMYLNSIYLEKKVWKFFSIALNQYDNEFINKNEYKDL